MKKILLVLFSLLLSDICFSDVIDNRIGKKNISFEFDGFNINEFLHQIGGKYWLTNDFAFVGGIDYGDYYEEDEFKKETNNFFETVIGAEFHEKAHKDISMFYGFNIGIGNEKSFESSKNGTKTYNTESSKDTNFQYLRILFGAEYFLTQTISLSAFYSIRNYTSKYSETDKLDSTYATNYSNNKSGTKNFIEMSPSELFISIYF